MTTSPFRFFRRRPKYALVECDGGPYCQAVRHVHGCYSDNGRNCDHPSEHRQALGVRP